MPTPSEPLPCIGVVLAGGRSSRMGRDKALLPWHGRPLIEHQIDILHGAGMEEVHVSGERPAYRGIADCTPHAGPLGGLASIAARLADARLIVIPVDMPRLGAALLSRLRDARADAGCVRFADHVLPMRLRLDAGARHALRTLMSATDDSARSLRALQRRVGTIELELSTIESAQCIDCNTRTQWQQLAS